VDSRETKGKEVRIGYRGISEKEEVDTIAGGGETEKTKSATEDWTTFGTQEGNENGLKGVGPN